MDLVHSGFLLILRSHHLFSVTVCCRLPHSQYKQGPAGQLHCKCEGYKERGETGYVNVATCGDYTLGNIALVPGLPRFDLPFVFTIHGLPLSCTHVLL